MTSSQISEKIHEIAENVKQMESIGRYEEAISFLSPFWTNLNEFPHISDLNAQEQAEIYLRCGSLVGYIGSCKQTKSSQELAKNLLIEARELFLVFEMPEKISECETHLASTYLRMGETEEARIWLNSAFSQTVDETSEIRLYTHIIDGLITLAEKQYAELVEKSRKTEKYFQASANYVLQGSFNNNYAIGLMRLKKIDKAIERFDLAKFFYNKTTHYLYLALLENNLAIFLQNEERYAVAHKSAISARENFKKLGDKTREGYSIDTRSQIFVAEGKYVEALECSNEAVKMLSDGENYCYLANSMQTKSHIEFYLKDYENSLKSMIASVNIASFQISQTQADKFREEYAKLLKDLEKK